MNVIDPGHVYELDVLDGHAPAPLRFVKREGPGYPGNVGHHAGITVQEVLRALIDRTRYLDRQEPSSENARALAHLQAALWEYEARTTRKRGMAMTARLETIERAPVCRRCGHVTCAAIGTEAACG